MLNAQPEIDSLPTDAFMLSFKRYKSKRSAPDMSKVINLDDMDCEQVCTEYVLYLACELFCKVASLFQWIA